MDIDDFVFLDTETTGLDPELHEIVELAWARGDRPIQTVRPRHTLRSAHPDALRINRYYERGLHKGPRSTPEEMSTFLLDVRGRTVVAANPAFDCGFLRVHFGWAPWRFRLLDIEAFAAGILHLERPPSLKLIGNCLIELGYDIPDPDHSAAGDVETLRRCYLALRDLQQRPGSGFPELAELLLA